MADLGTRREVWAFVPPNETKRAALMFDRIYKWPEYNGLFTTLFKLPTTTVERVFLGTLADTDWRPPDKVAFGSTEDDKAFEKVWSQLTEQKLAEVGGGQFKSDRIRTALSEASAEVLCNHCDTDTPGVFSSTYREYSKDYRDLYSSVDVHFEAALTQIPIVANERLDWKHVLAFREDKSNVRKYRDLRMWLRSGLEARTIDEAQELIAIKVEAYKDSVKQWGFDTVIGTLKQVFELRETAGAFGTAVATLYVGGELWHALAAGTAVATARTALFAAENVRKFEDVIGEHREVALLVDIEKIVGPKHSGLAGWTTWFRSLVSNTGS